MAHELRRHLPSTFGPFLGSFPRPSQVQELAVPELIAGRDVLMAAPTASGKTEAFAAPAAEITLTAGPKSFRALFVSPTRALANDLKRRLEGRFEQVGLTFGRYTGEHKERVDGRLPEVAVITLEALDSLLARRPEALRDVRIIVLDEIHVVDGTARGDHLRILLHRLEATAERRPQRVAASATVEDPEATAQRYLVDPAVVVVGGAREIRAKAFAGSSSAGLARHLTELSRHGFRKVLVFCNRRADVEHHAARLKGRTPYGDLVFPHHGSLARGERERTERLFLDAPTGVVVSTMTLEMGIDIGSIDYVLLVHPPPGVASLLQRVGRGNRRTGTTRAGYTVDDPGQELVFRTLLTAATRGELLGQPYALRPSVVQQQALVLAGARGWIDAPMLERAVPAFAWEAIAPTRAQDLLEALVEGKRLERSQGGRFVLPETIERMYDRGVVHSNIDSELVLEVVDRLTGDVIGAVSPQARRRMRLGGRSRKVVTQLGGRLLTDAGHKGGTTVFQPRGVPFVTLAFARRVVEALGTREQTMVQSPIAGTVILAHGLGTVGALLLQRLLDDRHGRGFVLEATPFVARLPEHLEELPSVEATTVERFVTRYSGQLAKLCAMGPCHRFLPEELQARAVRAASSVDSVVATLRAATLSWRETPNDEFLLRGPHL